MLILIALPAAALGAACSVVFGLDGYDTSAGGSGGGHGLDAGHDAAPDVGADAASDALADAAEEEAGPPPGPCDGKPDGTPCPGAVPCHAFACKQGACADKGLLPDGTQYDPSNDFARCCGGSAVHTDKDDQNCGVCGIHCVNGQHCKQQNPAVDPRAVFCTGCVPNGPCAGGLCCVTSVNAAEGVCAPTDCAGHCVDSKCPSMHCMPEATAINDYCYY